MAQLTQIAQSLKVGGNTNSPTFRGRKWCFTLNNYTAEDVTQLKRIFHDEKYIIGKEVGEGGTPHLQGYFEFKNPRSFQSVKKLIPKAHIEKCKGSAKQNWKYCTKENDYFGNLDFSSMTDKLKKLCLKEYDDVKWFDWQQEILDLLKMPANKRTIHWYWEPNGNSGKSYLCKYLAITSNIIICEGKKSDIFNQVLTSVTNDLEPKIIIMDVPRTALDYINYGALEQLKNGLIYSGKYEGGQVVFPCPHVIIFANKLPDKYKLSKDRWNIVRIPNEPR